MGWDIFELSQMRNHVSAMADLVGLKDILDTDDAASALIQLDSQRLTIAKAWERANAAAEEAFGNQGFFASPAWGILLRLYVERVEGGRQSSGAGSERVRTLSSSEKRWIDVLAAKGFVNRLCNINSPTYRAIVLSDPGFARMNVALDAAIMGDRDLGLSRMRFNAVT